MDAVIANSREMIRLGSRSFALAAKLFDADTRHHAYMLYAWCRYCDDEIDGQNLGMQPGPRSVPASASLPLTPGQGAEPAVRLERLRMETRRAFAGEGVTEPVFIGLQRVGTECGIPERHALELLAGFEMDVSGHEYRNFDDTLLYCYRVAGVVGVMMAQIMGVRDVSNLQRAADLGIAFQLTNIARDVLDDAGSGRCYLPATWLAEAGISTTTLRDPANRAVVARVAARLLDEAERYYRSADCGLKALPFRSAWAVAAALGIYRAIGRLVIARGARAWDSRVVVSTPRKLGELTLGALVALRAVVFDRWLTSFPRSPDLWTIPEP
ncbi:MAG: phytoene/squalene synthase family protein [Gammaproteobacteria bacterium]